MQADFILPHDPRWAGFLRTCPHDVYHLPEYLDFSASHEGAEPAAFLAEEDGAAMLIPMMLRRLPAALDLDGRWMDASAPYGYACPLLSGNPDPALVTRFLERFRSDGQERGMVSAFFRLHPLLPLPREPLMTVGDLVDHGETVFLDLTRPEADLDREMRTGHLHDIRKLERSGFTVELDAWDQLPEFIRIYLQTMARHAASPFYFFSNDYFRRLREALGERLHLALVRAPGSGAVASGALFMEEGGILEYHLGGTDEAFLQVACSKLMLHRLRNWGKARGDRLFHLGGGVGSQADSLFAFKKGFSHLRAVFTSFRMIVDPDVYAAVSSWRPGASERKVLERRRYFPGYRRPA